jgi:hypothetical protein
MPLAKMTRKNESVTFVLCYRINKNTSITESANDTRESNSEKVVTQTL